jgi:hypothetical protein
MSVDQWADITEAGSCSDWELGRGRPGGQRSTRTERAAQRLGRVSAATPLPLGRVCVTAGGIAGGGPAG